MQQIGVCHSSPMRGVSSSVMELAMMKPLPARSVVLSLMLGAHPEPMTPAQLSRAGAHFDIAASTLRAAVARAHAAGDLIRDESGYRLGARLLARQEHQNEAVEAISSAWQGDWELAVIVVSGRPGGERAALRETLRRHRLGELREGVWMRPANLRRPATYAHDPTLTTGRCYPDEDPEALVSTLWNLEKWTEAGHQLIDLLATPGQPAQRLAVAAHLVRHLATDPMLPAALLPESWPGPGLRAAYADYQQELRNLNA